MVDAVQRRATKLMVGNRISYKERLNKTSLISLSSRRIYLDFIFLFKCLHSYYDLDISNYLQFYNSEHKPYNLRNTELTFKTMQEQNYLGRLFSPELLVFGIIYLYLLGRGNHFQCSKRT